MQQMLNQTIIVFFIALGIFAIYLLAPILTPFLLATLLAYLMHPIVKQLEKWGIPHILSVILIFISLLLLFLLFIIILFPIVEKQIATLLEDMPKITTWIQETVLPWFNELVDTDTFKTSLSSALPKTTTAVAAVVHSGFTIIEWVITLVLTPIVTFYFLRDWDQIVNGINNLLPLSSRPTISGITKECDNVLGGFFRGQLLVMLALCLIYGIGLTLVGLHIGFMIGIIGGLLSIVPYLGSFFVVVTATITALVQFGTWNMVLAVWGVFIIGQTLEGYALTPYLVGKRIGLHPVAVIFAVMAGGTLFGFFGVLLALPVAAVIMVLVRFLNRRYHASKFYQHSETK